MFSIPLRPIVFVTEWVLATFIKIFFFDFHENHKHAGNVYQNHSLSLSGTFKRLIWKNGAFCYVLQINPAGIL